jgi:hypothetical protein
VPVRGDENIRRLDVAVNDSLGVRRFEPFGDLDTQFEQQIERERLAVDAMLERLAFEALHRQEWLALVRPDFVDGADVGMVERGSGPCFALEPFERARIASQIRREEFQRDETAKFRVFGFIDHPHPPPSAEPLDDAVVGDGPPDQ